ncbi:DUF3098 domain-containing protein [bacterium]|nr:DUF3098 domain-containing protein [bacterium]
MAATTEKSKQKKTSPEAKSVLDQPKPKRAPVQTDRFTWPFSRKNLYWFLASLAVIIIGYVFLGQGPYDSFSSLTLGPVLLVIGYVVLLPVSILVRDKRGQTNS